MQDGVMEILYYRTDRGGIAISLDEGETVIIPSGRKMPITPVWKETDEDLEDSLTVMQAGALEEFREKPPMTDLEQMAWNLRKAERQDEKNYAQPEPDHRYVRESALVVVAEFD